MFIRRHPKKSTKNVRYKRKKRPQRVKFRRRYASSLFQRSILRIWDFIKLTVFTFLIAGITLAAWKFWNTSPWIRIQAIHFEGDVPQALQKKILGFSGKNILKLKTGQMEKEFREAYPELKSLTLHRSWDRSIRVTGSYRDPVAFLSRSRYPQAIDSDGFLFRFNKEMPVPQGNPLLTGDLSSETLKKVAGTLFLFRKNIPSFYKRLQTIKTDRMRGTKITLFDDILLYWGDLNPKDDVIKGRRVQEILNRFHPQKKQATIRFLEDNRVVLDVNWRAGKPK